MDEFRITTETTSDLPDDLAKELEIERSPLSYIVDDKEYIENDPSGLSITDFYKKLRDGAVARTSQVNRDAAKSFFTESLKTAKKILHLSFSSALSGTFDSFDAAAKEINSEAGEEKIIVIDTKCASLGQGMYVYLASMKKKAGESFEAVANWARGNIMRQCHLFTVNDLFFLQKGGRVSKTVAIVGSLLGMKPVMHVNREGKLIPIGKIRGRRQSLESLVERMGENFTPEHNETIFISHGDCIEDVEVVKNEVIKKFGKREFVINNVGTVIGSHSGPGTVALFYFGTARA